MLGSTLLGKLALELGIPIAHWLLERGWDYIRAYIEPPKTLEELRENLYYENGKWNCPAGQDAHHIAEQDQARKEGFSEEKIQDRDNLVCISTLKHWELSGYYQRYSEKYLDESGNQTSLRNSLKGKSWSEKREKGLEALREQGILQ